MFSNKAFAASGNGRLFFAPNDGAGKSGEQPGIILASASPRRQALLRALGIPFKVEPSGIDETAIPWTGEREFALRAAMAKALDVAERHESSLVIGADTIVCMDGRILGKPRDRGEAREMLLALRGRDHKVITGICVAASWNRTQALHAVETLVAFRRFTQKTLEWYLDTGESLDKAGAYGIQEKGGRLVKSVEGDYFNVVGLPLECLLELMSRFVDVRPWRERLETLEKTNMFGRRSRT